MLLRGATGRVRQGDRSIEPELGARGPARIGWCAAELRGRGGAESRCSAGAVPEFRLEELLRRGCWLISLSVRELLLRATLRRDSVRLTSSSSSSNSSGVPDGRSSAPWVSGLGLAVGLDAATDDRRSGFGGAAARRSCPASRCGRARWPFAAAASVAVGRSCRSCVLRQFSRPSLRVAAFFAAGFATRTASAETSCQSELLRRQVAHVVFHLDVQALELVEQRDRVDPQLLGKFIDFYGFLFCHSVLSCFQSSPYSTC